MTDISIVALAICILLGAGPCVGQTNTWSVGNPSGNAALSLWGDSIFPMGDVNGDGAVDILASDPRASTAGLVDAGLIQILSGSDGTVISSLSGASANEFVYSPGVVGDVDGDGVKDYLYLSNLVSMQVRSGGTGSVLLSGLGQFPGAVADLGDLNGDGFSEWSWGGGVVPPPGFYGTITVFSGPTGAPLFYAYGDEPLALFGSTIARGHDFNGDGVRDILVSGPSAFAGNFALGRGWAYVCSGADGSIIHKFIGPPQVAGVGAWYGSHLASPGDTDGDGVPDVLVLAPGVFTAYLYSGATWAQIGAFPAQGHVSIGHPPDIYFVTPGDVDGDGCADFGIHGQSMWFEVYSGKTQAVLMRVFDPPPLPIATLTKKISLGDSDGDGFPNLAFGSFTIPGGNSLRTIWSYNLAPAGVASFGAGCAAQGGLVPRIGFSGLPLLGASIQVNLRDVPAQAPALLLLGTSNSVWLGNTLPMDLGPAGMPGCSLLVAPEQMFSFLPVAIGGTAAASMPFTIPQAPFLPGAVFYLQWAVATQQGSPVSVRLSRALEVTIL